MTDYEEMTLESALETARIHTKRLREAMDELRSIFPISEQKANNLSREEVILIDSFILRFSKLQDLMGSSLFDLYLENTGENTDGLTILDKVHKLEKLWIIEDTEEWKEMRKMRNRLAHEYPHRPDLVAKFLNGAYELAPKLISYLETIERRVKDIKR